MRWMDTSWAYMMLPSGGLRVTLPIEHRRPLLQNRQSFERMTGLEPAFVLYFDCPEGVMVDRLLRR